MNWQPIETAPKDGTIVLLYRRDWAVNICAGYWDFEWCDWFSVGAPSPFLSAAYWQPLPEPPKDFAK